RAADLSLLYGQALRRVGRVEEAEGAFQENLTLRRALGDQRGEAWALMQLGYISLRRGDLEAAEPRFTAALDLCRAVGDRKGEGVTLSALGDLAEAQNDADEAETYYRQGLAMLREAQDAFHTAGAARDLGSFLLEQRAQREEGCALLAESARLFAAMGLRE